MAKAFCQAALYLTPTEVAFLDAICNRNTSRLVYRCWLHLNITLKRQINPISPFSQTAPWETKLEKFLQCLVLNALHFITKQRPSCSDTKTCPFGKSQPCFGYEDKTGLYRMFSWVFETDSSIVIFK